MTVHAHVRWMIRRDMPEVLEIEDEAFEFPWGETDFGRTLGQRNCIGLVATLTDERVAGYAIYELAQTRLSLLNLAVADWARRQGVGRTLIEKIQSKLSMQRRSLLVTQCRETNVRGHLFFQVLGFRAVSVLRRFYADWGDGEDAYVFQYRVPQPAQSPAS